MTKREISEGELAAVERFERKLVVELLALSADTKPSLCSRCAHAVPHHNEAYVRCGWPSPLPQWIAGYETPAARMRPVRISTRIVRDECAAFAERTQ